MWLLDVQTYQLVFFANPPPLYAILSHTWGDEEVTFQDMSNISSARKKAGWKKIQYTCDEAVQDYLPYAWVDTCCINKTSSAELSEAINSMFGWYRQAQTCYAYLSDFRLDISAARGASQPRELVKELSKCRWFSRGWTLQELIAAPSVVFFNRKWRKIGTKATLQRELAKITGIDQQVLQRMDHIYQIPAGRRMSWAAKRQTTRIEDVAYCLLGIFDVNMPLLYGEGDKAFIRLQEQITREHPDLSLFAWCQLEDEPVFRGIFVQSPAEFTCCSTLVSRKPSLFPGVNFSVTEAGVVITRDLNITDSREYVELDTKCLNTSGSVHSRSELPKWIVLSLQRFGDTFVRRMPGHHSHPIFALGRCYRPDRKEQMTITVRKTLAPSQSKYFTEFSMRGLVLAYRPELAQIFTNVVPHISDTSRPFDGLGSTDRDEVKAICLSANVDFSEGHTYHNFSARGGGDLIWWASFDIPRQSGEDLHFGLVCGIPGLREGSSDDVVPWFALFFSEDECFEHQQMVVLIRDHERMDCSPETQNRLYDAIFGIFADASGNIAQGMLPTSAIFTDGDEESHEVFLNIIGGGESIFVVDVQYH